MKRGVVSSSVIILVIAIVGFIMALLIFSQFIWNEEIDRQLCHTSVITRATLPNTGGMQGLIALKCPTQKVCIGGKNLFSSPNCEDTFGEKPSNLIKVEVETKNEIEKYLAQEMVECWKMMGEGKVSLFSQYWAEEYGLERVYPTCVICSRIAFDKESLDNEKYLKMQEINILKYMFENKIPGKDVSYYEYFYDEGGKMSLEENLIIEDSVSKQISENFKTSIEESYDNSNEAEFNIDKLFVDRKLSEIKENEYQEIAVIFMQISAPTSYFEQLAKTTLTALGLGASGKMIISPWITRSSRIIPLPIKAIFGGSLASYQGANYLINREVTAGYCGDVSLGDDSRSGCSVVRVINYNSEDLLKYCSVVESIDS